MCRWSLRGAWNLVNRCARHFFSGCHLPAPTCWNMVQPKNMYTELSNTQTHYGLIVFDISVNVQAFFLSLVRHTNDTSGVSEVCTKPAVMWQNMLRQNVEFVWPRQIQTKRTTNHAGDQRTAVDSSIFASLGWNHKKSHQKTIHGMHGLPYSPILGIKRLWPALEYLSEAFRSRKLSKSIWTTAFRDGQRGEKLGIFGDVEVHCR